MAKYRQPMNIEPKCVTSEDLEYPGCFRVVFGALLPPEIWYVGNVDIINTKGVGFCGSRDASKYGLEIAADCASQLSAADVTIVSGYAPGVDMAAHDAALKSGRTDNRCSSRRHRSFSYKEKHCIGLGLATRARRKSISAEGYMAR
jgi:predicted Rossmann fold nucleotide-binding protein DprA/Smf involved in DNA uptake